MKAAKEYQQLVGKEYQIRFSNAAEIRLIFKAAHFKHLAGLNKLKDLDFIWTEQRAANLFKKSLSGEITWNDLNCSCLFDSDARSRLECLCRISEVLAPQGLAVFNFDRALCLARASFKSSIIFFKDDGCDFFITFGAAKDVSGEYLYPETIFYRFDRAYITGQNIVSIVDVNVKTAER